MTYNLHVGIPMGHEFGEYTVGESDLQNLADVITSQSADIVAMQEVDCEFGATLTLERRRTSCLNEPRQLSLRTGLNYIFGSVQDDFKYPSDNAGYVEWGSIDHWQNNGAEHGEVGNAILSRLPFKSPPGNLPLPKSKTKERRACLRVELLQAGKLESAPPVVIYATHLQHDSAFDRAMQMKFILNQAKLEPQEKIVFLLGDLNHTSRDSRHRQEQTTAPDLIDLAENAGFVDLHKKAAEKVGGIPAMTFPADIPVERIDYILCNRDLEVIQASVPETLSSDHRPVVIEVKLPPRSDEGANK
jgi:endonuclease/exonuclease/phosphatase family metal-dependent hydrolase